MAIQSLNPATGQLLATFEALAPPAIEDRLARAWAAFTRRFRASDPPKRALGEKW